MRRDIQGLRGIAVLIVVLFHGSLGFNGGFVGVDVFFVISGYVITGVLVRGEGGTESTSSVVSSFYVRRVRRLLPALGTLICATLITSLAFESSLREQSRTAWSAVASLLFSANVQFLTMSDGYFSLGSQTNPLLHVWSLSIEEQFYLVFPIVFLYLTHKDAGMSRIRKWFTVGAGLSLALCILLTYGAIGGSGRSDLPSTFPSRGHGNSSLDRSPIRQVRRQSSDETRPSDASLSWVDMRASRGL